MSRASGSRGAADLPAFIRKIGLFSELPDKDVASLAEQCTSLSVGAGRQIFDQGDPPNDIFIIIQGKVKIVRKGEDGREATLAVLVENDFFGEISIFTDEPRSAAAVAVEETRLIRLERDHLFSVIIASPAIGIELLTALSRRLLEADRTIASLLWDTAYQKVILTLHRIMKSEGIVRGDAVVVKRRVTHQEIADMAGTSRETASRILAYLKRAGAVVPSGRNLIIRERAFPTLL